MRLLDAILNVERPEATTYWDYSTNSEEICESLNISGFYFFPEELDKRLKAYPIFSWYCTNENVGLKAIYLDDEAVGCTYKSAHKSNAKVEWISKELADKVRNVIVSYSKILTLNLIDPDQDIGDNFNVQYVSQLLTDKGLYNDQPVSILVKYDWLIHQTTPEKYRVEGKPYTVKVDYEDPRRESLLVRNEDGEEFLIHITDFKMRFNLNAHSS